MEADEKQFSELIRCKSESFSQFCWYIINCSEQNILIERTPLGTFFQEVRRLEEILDAYGARHNAFWLPLRRVVAAAKFASDGLYKALHLKYAIPFYHVKPIDGDCPSAIDCAVDEFTTILARISQEYLDTCKRLGVVVSDKQPIEYCSDAETPPFQLARDIPNRIAPDPGRTIINLSTFFLNLIETSGIAELYENTEHSDINTYIPELMDENDLRRFENDFHSIQAAYDTSLAGTDVESEDPDLRYLRGHVTVIYHLMEIATAVTHYYERHVLGAAEDSPARSILPEETAQFLLINFCLGYAAEYLQIAQDLCRELLGRYAEIGELAVPVPTYRGFHVRPSSLVAKIVRHYGTDVTMSLGEEVCDASSPMDIIRLNERIYAEKRHRLAEDVTRLAGEIGGDDPLRVILSLLEEERIVLYSGDIQLKDFPRIPDETLAEYTNRAVARLLATGKIDIRSDITVQLRGDIRVLQDVQTLARHGYGEDAVGNNVTLPVELSYLKR